MGRTRPSISDPGALYLLQRVYSSVRSLESSGDACVQHQEAAAAAAHNMHIFDRSPSAYRSDLLLLSDGGFFKGEARHAPLCGWTGARALTKIFIGALNGLHKDARQCAALRTSKDVTRVEMALYLSIYLSTFCHPTRVQMVQQKGTRHFVGGDRKRASCRVPGEEEEEEEEGVSLVG